MLYALSFRAVSSPCTTTAFVNSTSNVRTSTFKKHASTDMHVCAMLYVPSKEAAGDQQVCSHCQGTSTAYVARIYFIYRPMCCCFIVSGQNTYCLEVSSGHNSYVGH